MKSDGERMEWDENSYYKCLWTGWDGEKISQKVADVVKSMLH